MYEKRIRARDQFLSESTDEPRARVVISKSWERSRKYRIDPLIRQAPAECYDDQEPCNRQLPRIQRVVAHIVGELQPFFDEKYAVAIADQEGRIVDLFARGRLYEQLCSVHFSPGGLWKEEHTGTNAIGTALAVGESVVINDAEHYCESWQPFSCAGTPVYDLTDHTVAGVIDMTCFAEEFPDNSLLLTNLLAKKVERELNKERQMEKLILENQFLHWTWTLPNDILVCIDSEGRMIRTNVLVEQWNRLLAACGVRRVEWSEMFEHFDKVKPNKWTELPLNMQTDTAPSMMSVNVFPILSDERPIGAVIQIPHSRSHALEQRAQIVLPNSSKLSVSHSPCPPDLPDEETAASLQAPVGESPKWIEIMNRARRVATRDVTVLLCGESGTGKEEIAQYIHSMSDRRNQPFLAYNCSVVTHDLAASELFGYAPGAFTGALRTGKVGLFESANGGTLFLDEISELPVSVQAMLLRVLQEKKVTRIGEYESRPVNVRIIAAANRDLETAIREGKFRLDLYFRLNTVTLYLPPLRERPSDIPLLVGYFLYNMHNGKTGRNGRSITISPETLHYLTAYHWPGNVRELKNTIEYASLFADGGVIGPEHLPEHIRQAGQGTSISQESAHPEKTAKSNESINQMRSDNEEKQRILSVLQSTRYNISKAARVIGVSRGTLYKRLKQYNIEV
ncbi:sigma-54-dependent Fis family transcriptional regulator [Kyrpidia tusciae]|uniref:GAF modulated sigma54 specific transcriptional regulator, Fis family n=1 Tax=Kyrpidia tusciae (strain DSM 2912 / NBRC 15312 / T2) TaxID=562970 RepID=D5WPL0_KYRT2|nr:sigma-54-dependent Fis family transcriptional regulator [Kyrpidia tusciae]ADG06269.1 GAF modulated sigma54 specific transcriptional regulator, Fis family [Kyrpidia tusciae DSM 2912]